ncbi:MAG: serine hydrolase [Pseudomonadota bacterium]
MFMAALAIAPLAALAAPFAAYVIDARTGQVLYQTNAETRLHPASLTKMMTLYVTFQAIERGEITLDTRVTISQRAAGQAPSKLGLKPGQKIALRYLIRAAAIKSANDAATAIAEAISGSEPAFAERMTRTAKALGMTGSTFKNANGLTAAGHLSTARDLTLLGRHLFYDYPQYYNVFSRRTADAGVAQVASTNRKFLESYEGADGIKTGYTVPAGFNLTASAQRGDKRIIATILGGLSTASRNQKMADLLDLGFRLAPDRAPVQKPALPAYEPGGQMLLADAAPGATPGSASGAADDPVAAQIAADVDIGMNDPADGPAAGKTLRVAAAVQASPRPASRPPSDAGMTETVAEAPAGATAAAPVPTASAVPVADAPETPAADGPVFAQTASPQPETLALAAADPAAAASPLDPAAAEALARAVTAAGVGRVDTSGTPPVPVLTASAADPGASPATAPEPDTGIATAGVTDIDAAVLLALGGGSGGTAMPGIRPQARPGNRPSGTGGTPDAELQLAALGTEEPPTLTDAVAFEDTAAAAQTVDAAATDTAATEGAAMETAVALAPDSASALAGTADPGAAAPPVMPEIILAEAVEPSPPAPQLEVVTRVSSSGGRQWGISVGRFGSRNEAERVLIRTALIEMNSLDEALRKVVSRGGRFDASFVGMTEQGAELACRRLIARSSDCTVIEPTGEQTAEPTG